MQGSLDLMAQRWTGTLRQGRVEMANGVWLLRAPAAMSLSRARCRSTGAVAVTLGAADTRVSVVRLTAICSVGGGVEEQAARAPRARTARMTTKS